MSLLETLEAELSFAVQEFDKDASVMVQFAAGGLHRIREAMRAERAALTPTPVEVSTPTTAPEVAAAPTEETPHVA